MYGLSLLSIEKTLKISLLRVKRNTIKAPNIKNIQKKSHSNKNSSSTLYGKKCKGICIKLAIVDVHFFKNSGFSIAFY